MSNGCTFAVRVIVALTAIVVSAVARPAEIPSRIKANGRCVSCHSETVDLDFTKRNLHIPFFDRQCIACHLEDNSELPTSGVANALKHQITGMVVSQQSMWRKRVRFQGAGEETTDHLVVANGLDLDRAYRFRIISASTLNSDTGEEPSSKWMGLLPAEVHQDMPMDLPVRNTGLTAADGVTVQSLRLGRTGGFIVVTWQTDSLSSGWLEVEALEEVGLADMPQSEGNDIESVTKIFSEEDHTDMRDPMDITIDVCYSCHLTSTLSSSHPIGIYSRSSSTRIPDDLPTVDGLLTCVTCHHPHSSDGKALTRKRVVTELCIACHFKFNRYSLDDSSYPNG